MVMSAVRCRHLQLEEQSIPLRLLMTSRRAHGAVYFIKHKSDVLDKFKEFATMIINDADRPMELCEQVVAGNICSKNSRTI